MMAENDMPSDLPDNEPKIGKLKLALDEGLASGLLADAPRKIIDSIIADQTTHLDQPLA
jgi:hypothetical protein